MSFLGFIAGATKTLRLGTYVIPAINRDPLTLAKQVATVDLLSGGRVELGIGAGYLPEEAEVLGRPSDHRHAPLDETIDILRKAWGNPSFEHHGRFWDIPAVAIRPAPAQGAGLPIWIGGRGPSALRTTRERGDGILTPKATPDSVATMRAALSPKRRVGRVPRRHRRLVRTA
jgi:alkanesulfonate monooxygenase SsuD/methylene tetrahydromethanopterin reductase-like flavin-dependent oxidoreductase (luciferase family)